MAGPATADKPYKSSPLTAHRNGQFREKIRGQLFCFGSVKDPDAALNRYHEHCGGRSRMAALGGFDLP